MEMGKPLQSVFRGVYLYLTARTEKPLISTQHQIADGARGDGHGGFPPSFERLTPAMRLHSKIQERISATKIQRHLWPLNAGYFKNQISRSYRTISLQRGESSR